MVELQHVFEFQNKFICIGNHFSPNDFKLFSHSTNAALHINRDHGQIDLTTIFNLFPNLEDFKIFSYHH